MREYAFLQSRRLKAAGCRWRGCWPRSDIDRDCAQAARGGPRWQWQKDARGYDSAELRLWLKRRGTAAVISNRANRKQPLSFDRNACKQRHRYDRLARNFLASICQMAAIIW